MDKKNKLDKQYTDLLQDILDNGVPKKTRNGYVLSVFGRTIRHSMKDGFPLLTSKKMAWKSIVTELLWFLRGDTNIKFLLDNNCNIWTGDAYANYVKWNEFSSNPHWLKPVPLENGYNGTTLYSQKEFVEKILTDDEFCSKWGSLGPIYGSGWRNFEGVDQIKELIHLLKTDPDSRRLKVSAWQPHRLKDSVLPPCHTDFQCYTRELSYDEKVEYARSIYGKEGWWDINDKRVINILKKEKRAISLMWNQRSVNEKSAA